MGRPCGCCADCVSIWSIDQQNGSVKWKKDFGYVYSITQYNDLLFALVHDTEPQVVCLRKSTGGKVDEKSFKIPTVNSNYTISAASEDEVFIFRRSLNGEFGNPNGGLLYRYIDKELSDIYLFNSPSYKFLNRKIFGFGGNTEDYYKYTILHQNPNGLKITFADMTNINDITVTFSIVTEKYNLEWELALNAQTDDRNLISSEDDLQLPDIIDSVNFGSDFIELNFHIVPKLSEVTFGETINSDESINARLFGRINRPLGTTYYDGLNNKLQSAALNSYSEIDSHGYYDDAVYRYGEIFNTLYDTDPAITIPGLVEEFDLTTLEYSRHELSKKSDELINLSQGLLQQEYVITTIQERPITPIGNCTVFDATLNYDGAGLEVFQPYMSTFTQQVFPFVRDDTKKIDTNRSFPYGYNMEHQDDNDFTEKVPGPNLPATSPLQTIVAYVNVNSGTSLNFYLDEIPDVSEFIEAYNNPSAYIKNIFYHTKVTDIHYDSETEEYIMNAEYYVHWIYLREEFLGYGYDGRNSGWRDIFDVYILESNQILTAQNAAQMPIVYAGPNQTHNDVMYYTISLQYPSQGYVSLAQDYGYTYVLTQDAPSADYVGGNFLVQTQVKFTAGRLQNIYGFDVILDRETGVERGLGLEREMVFHKFTEPVLSGFDLPRDDGARMVWTIPMHTNLITSDFEDYEFLDIDNQIYPYLRIPEQTDNVKFLEYLYARSMLLAGSQMNNQMKYDSYPNQPERNPSGLLQYWDSPNAGFGLNYYYIMEFDLHETFDQGFPKSRYKTKNDINIEYLKDKTKLSYNEDLDSILYNNSVRLIVNNNGHNYVYYKSLDGALSTSIDIYTVRYNLSETTVSGLCPILVFQPVKAEGLENGQIKIVIKMITCEYENGTKTYQIRNIERDIDLMDGDLTPILDDLNSQATSGTFSFLTDNTNITEDWVMIIFDTDVEIDIFSGRTKQVTEEVTITDNGYDEALIDSMYAYTRD